MFPKKSQKFAKTEAIELITEKITFSSKIVPKFDLDFNSNFFEADKKI